MSDNVFSQREATCSKCGRRFTYRTKPEFGGWVPKLCLDCKQPGGKPATARSAAKSSPKYRPVHSGDSSAIQKIHTGLFTDGGSRGNPGRGGWGFAYVIDDVVVKEDWGGEDMTTNNRMELTAIIRALQAVGDIDVTLYTDSQLCVKTYNEWMAGWKRRGWKKKDGPIANLDLIMKLDELKQQCPSVRVQWVRGHNGLKWNEYVDELTQRY